MRQTLHVLIIVATLLLAISGTVLAQPGEPVGGCPDGFELHSMMEDGEHMHHHIGNDADQNGDGYLCMKHVGKDQMNHVHIDNNVPCDPNLRVALAVHVRNLDTLQPIAMPYFKAAHLG